ncbi:MAG: S41 family peptidase [Ferruginibacter sp.]
MQKANFLSFIIILFLFTGCAVSKNYDPGKKFPKQELQEDYSLLRNILEKKHPALYWYTPKDSMDYYFDSLYNNIADSMTEQQFGWKILGPLTNKIHCGHTSFGMSKNWNRFIRNKRTPSFPLYIKLCGDTMVVTGNLNPKDSIIKRGTLLTSINGVPNRELLQKMFQYLPLDGYSDNVNYIRISSNFPYYHRNIFGIYKNYRVGYIDSTGIERTVLLPMYSPATDSARKKEKTVSVQKFPRYKIKEERRESYRSLEIDTGTHTATMLLNTFSNGGGRHLRSFIKRAFKSIRKQQAKNLIIDIRSNGGGDVTMYVKLARYIRNTKFRVADSSYAVAKNLAPYTAHIKQGFFNNIGLFFLTKKHADGNYHFGYWERHVYRPKTTNHFNGKVYVLTNGPTFSASTLFCNAVKGQTNVTIVGEETGGGWHGNSGIMIPDIILPITKLRVRLPLFKLVQYNHVPKDGRGVSPDIFIPPTVEGVRHNIDRKMEIVKGMILQSKEAAGYKQSNAK